MGSPRGGSCDDVSKGVIRHSRKLDSIYIRVLPQLGDLMAGGGAGAVVGENDDFVPSL